MNVNVIYGDFNFRIPNCKSIYNAVDIFEKEFFIEKNTSSKSSILLRDIINLHNIDGIKSLDVIKNMMNDIKSGKDILMPSSIPNVKVAKNNNEYILFDGHHSILAYMLCGKKYLNEIPHLIVSGDFSNDDFKVFFGEHAESIDFWKNYTINWQNPCEEQLCKRIQNDIGELFDLIKIYI